MTSIFPKTVEENQLAKASIVSSMLGDVSYALGPLLGAVSYGTVGISVVFLVDGLTSLFGAVLSSLMKVGGIEVRSKTLKNILGSHWRGMQLIFSDKRIGYLMSNEILNHVFLFPFLSLFIPFLIITVLMAQTTPTAWLDLSRRWDRSPQLRLVGTGKEGLRLSETCLARSLGSSVFLPF